MARPRMSTKQKKLHGTSNVTLDRDRSDMNYPVLVPDAVIEPPSHLSNKSKMIWNILIKRTLSVQILSDTDIAYLQQGMEIQEELDRVNSMLATLRSKPELDDKEFLRWNKLSARQTALLHSYIEVFGRFGVSPAERAKLQAITPPENKEIEPDSITAILFEAEEMQHGR